MKNGEWRDSALETSFKDVLLKDCLLVGFFFLFLFVCCILTTGCLWRLSSCAVCSSLACLLRLQCPSNRIELWNGCLLQSFVALAAQAFPCFCFRLMRHCAYTAQSHSMFSAGIVFWNSTQNSPENAWAGAKLRVRLWQLSDRLTLAAVEPKSINRQGLVPRVQDSKISYQVVWLRSACLTLSISSPRYVLMFLDWTKVSIKTGTGFIFHL